MSLVMFFFFFNDTATTEIYTLSLHDALPISRARPDAGPGTRCWRRPWRRRAARSGSSPAQGGASCARSEEHTSELQSRQYLVCRLLLEKKKKKRGRNKTTITLIASPSSRRHL